MGLEELLEEGKKLSEEAYEQMGEAEFLGTLIKQADGLELEVSLVDPLAKRINGFGSTLGSLYEWVNDALEEIRKANPGHKGDGGESHGDE